MTSISVRDFTTPPPSPTLRATEKDMVFYELLKDELLKTRLTRADLLLVLTRGIIYIDKTIQSGEFKKAELINTTLSVIDELDIELQKKELLKEYIQSEELSCTIDIVISASKGKLNINKTRSLLKKIFRCICK